jgi:hypothetical protein
MDTSNEVRRKILRAQHARLRVTIETARATARNALAAGGPAGPLQMAVTAVLATFSIRKQRRLLGGSHGEGR